LWKTEYAVHKQVKGPSAFRVDKHKYTWSQSKWGQLVISQTSTGNGSQQLYDRPLLEVCY